MKFVIAERKEIAEGTMEAAFDIRGREFPFQAGQYIELTLPQLMYADERGATRSFSIASSSGNKQFLRIAFRVSDSGFKRTLADMPLGSEVAIEGPFGDMTLPVDDSSPIVFIAGGIGITPFMSMLRRVAEEKLPHRITLLYANRTPESAAYANELEELARQNPHFILRNHLGLLDGAAVQKNVDADAIKTARWYVVGPPAMALATEKILYELGVERRRVRLTEFSGYPASAPASAPQWAFTKTQSLSEAVLNALNDNVLVSITDLQGAIVYANDKFVEVSKYSRGELIGQNHRMLKSGFHSAEFYAELWRAISVGRAWRGEIKNRAKDGSFYWVDASIAPIVGNAGEVAGYIAIHFLITEQKKLEGALMKKDEDAGHRVLELQETKTALLNVMEDLGKEKSNIETTVKTRTRELQEEQARLIAAIGGLSLGFLMMDKDERVILKNPAFRRIFEFADDAFDVSAVAAALGSAFDLAARFRECLEKGALVDQRDIAFKNKFLRIFIAPVTLLRDHNEIIGAIVLVEDITEAKLLERSREEFFAIASHEMRTPLTAIRGNMSLIKDFFGAEIKNPEIREMVDDSYQASVRLIGIINDFLDASRLEQGKISFKKEKFDITELVQETVREVANLAKGKNLSLTINKLSKAELLTVFADRERIKQVIYNLLSNAINYTAKGRIVIEIKKADSFAHVFVADTGDGISPQNQNMLFRKFQQAGEQILVRDVTKSTGLGLYISKMLVEAMGGKIWLVESVLGKGSTFAFTLPIAP